MEQIGLPVLKSVILSNKELEKFEEKEIGLVKSFLKNNYCMIRYLYHSACYHVKNGGKIVEISKAAIQKEYENGTDFWLLEPVRREDNLFCCNVCLNRGIGNLHMEFLGCGFDISDINKGKIVPHERIDIPYPISYGANGEWWKWAHFWFCADSEYRKSIAIRKQRLQELQEDNNIIFSISFNPVSKDIIECIIGWIKKVEDGWEGEKPDFYNLSCSFQKDGKGICWDIQTPKGKMDAYIDKK